MSYTSTTILAQLTGSSRDTAVLQAIIDEAGRQVTAYLRAKGIGPNVVDETQSACLLLSQAGLLRLGLQEGSFEARSADFTSSVNVTSAVVSMEKRAMAILDDYIARQIAGIVPRRMYVMRVN